MCAANTRTAKEVWSCRRDEGRPLGAGDQEQASNHCELLPLRAVVVSVAGKGGAGHVRQRRYRIAAGTRAAQPPNRAARRLRRSLFLNALFATLIILAHVNRLRPSIDRRKRKSPSFMLPAETRERRGRPRHAPTAESSGCGDRAPQCVKRAKRARDRWGLGVASVDASSPEKSFAASIG